MQPYDPAWATKFAQIKARLSQVLDSHSVSYKSIEHVGSTSVPGLVAKPIIDIDIIITESSVSAIRAALTAADYTDCGECGIPGRYQFRQPGLTLHDNSFSTGPAPKDGGADATEETILRAVRHNLYATIEGCASLRNHLDVRRVLMEDEDLRAEYGGVKAKLAEKEMTGINDYVFGKTEVLCKILTKAGWSQEELAPIIKVNAL